MKSLFPFVLVATAALQAQAAEYSAVQTDKSALTFISKQMGVPVNGRFPKFTAQIAFDPAKPEAGKVNITIDLASTDAGSKDATDEVVGKEWFNVRMFPTATFTSTSMKSVGGGKYEVAGTLAIKGKSRPVTATFVLKPDGSNGVFDGGFTLKRIDYAIGEGSWTDVSMVANDVQVNFHIVATTTVATAAPGKTPVTTPAASPAKATPKSK